MKTIKKITNAQISEKGVRALADRPNANSQYGASGLSAQQLKLWFDKLAVFLSEKYNELLDVLSGTDAADYVRIALDAYGVTSLQDLVDSFGNGSFAEKLMMVLPHATATVRQEIQAVIYNFAQRISANEEEITTLWADAGCDVGFALDKKTNMLTLKLYNKAGTALKTINVDVLVDTGRLANNAVTTEKILNAAITTPKVADRNITTSKIAKKAVTSEELADTSVGSTQIKEFAVQTKHITDASVVESKLGESAITRGKIKDAAVNGDKLAAGSVTPEKLSSALNNRILKLESDAFISIEYNAATGVLTFTSVDGKTKSVDLPLELLVTDNSYYDKTKGSEAIVLVLANGSEIRIPTSDVLSSLISYMDSIREKIFDLQEAPPLSALSDAILLVTPTLAQLAALS